MRKQELGPNRMHAFDLPHSKAGQAEEVRITNQRKVKVNHQHTLCFSNVTHPPFFAQRQCPFPH